MRFLRDREQEIVRPELLGLPPGMGRTPTSIERARNELVEVLKEGEPEACRRIVLEVYLSGVSVVKLCEELIAPVMKSIGDSWECGDLEVFQEHRASEMVNRALYDLRMLLPPPAPGAPTAMGGSPEGDHYRLSSLVVELALVEAGWNAVSLGSSLPFDTMAAAVRQHEPRLFWISFTHARNTDALHEDFAAFLTALPEGVQVVMGGQRLSEELGGDHPRVHRCESLAGLKEVAASF